MKQIFCFFVLILILMLAIIEGARAQAIGCGTGRYETDNLFTVKRTNNILYGSNINVNGANQNLYLNFYEPNGDTASKRPLMIVAFGGSFITGDRSQVDFICQAFTKMGYCCAAIDYRYGFPFPIVINQTTTTLVVVRAMHDMKAAVRFFKKDAATSNIYKIDTNRIILGGVSAGAVTALHAAYLDKETEVPSYIFSDTAGMGGIEGKSGNPGYSSKVAGIFSYSGCIGDTNWIGHHDVPIISFHESGDNTVPYDTREVRVSGVATGLIASGSRDIHARCDHVSTVNMLYTYNSSGHTQYLASDPLVFQKTRDFFFEHVTCKQDMPAGVATNMKRTPEVNLYPNPTSDILFLESFVETNRPYNVYVYDGSGKEIYSAKYITGSSLQLQLSVVPGVYRVVVQYHDPRYSLFSRTVLFE